MAASASAAGGAALDPANSSKNTFKIENTEKRDTLIAIEKKYQARWAKNGIFQSNAPTTEEEPFVGISSADLRAKYPKFYGTMAFPYMNGTLHAGHSFTVSKIEFNTGFARMQGKRALFPLGFHCTGMPIKACADKLVKEVKMFGQEFERCPELGQEAGDEGQDKPTSEVTPATAQAVAREDVTKFNAKKSKAVAKSIKTKYQFQIMLALGIPIKDIHLFANPHHWLEFFPPLCKRDLTNFGARIDWRRSMVTTDANPYFDAFVRWQMVRLRELKKIRKGVRETIYSPKDGQPCMDHDRSDGEGVLPQRYTGLKLKVKELAAEAEKLIISRVPKDASIYLVAATLRPETMYGQTCCFVGPKISYGLFKINESEYYVMTERAARNMAYQQITGVFPTFGEYQRVTEIPGSSLIGTLVNAPLSIHKDGVRVLPMDSVLATKGTGVVTSVPSDSPDDYATVTDLAKKAEYYGIKKEWAELEIVPIISTPSYGDMAAPFLVKQMKINSPKDTKQLAEAKTLAYKEGYYQGVMSIGEFKGQKVVDVKEKVQELLEKQGGAFAYFEPEGLVMSRSGEECVVAKMEQWYLNYGKGDPEWRDQAIGLVKGDLETYSSETQHGFEGVLNWLNEWACARSFGLGSKLPFDKEFLVESLSDSTIYNAYYTIAHMLHGDIFGKTVGTLNIKPEQMTDEVFDYVFARRDLDTSTVESSGISRAALESMRREFTYWYPLDIRVSGKDLINNHLTFFIYIHIAMFPPEFWPRSIRANGHLMLNGGKMSKSTGNFLTLEDTVNKFGADASRIALADAGDGVEDANFEEAVANSNILRLYTLKEWCEEMIRDQAKLRSGPKDGIFDRLFDNEMNHLVSEARAAYESTNYKLALKYALYDFTSARDFYREALSAAGLPPHGELIHRYVTLQALLLSPIAPHWSEYIWLEVLSQASTIQNALWPECPTADASLSAAREYVRATSSSITSAEAAQQKRKDKGKAVAFDPKLPKRLTIFAATQFPTWQDSYLDLVRTNFDALHLCIDDKKLMAGVGKLGGMKRAMPFVQGIKKRLLSGESANAVFERKLAFDEVDTLRGMSAGLRRTTGCREVRIVTVSEKAGGSEGKTAVVVEGSDEGSQIVDLPHMADTAVPGVPTFFFENVKD